MSDGASLNDISRDGFMGKTNPIASSSAFGDLGNLSQDSYSEHSLQLRSRPSHKAQPYEKSWMCQPQPDNPEFVGFQILALIGPLTNLSGKSTFIKFNQTSIEK